MLKRFVHWLVFIALVLHLFSCIFLGVNNMPEVLF
jgi:hypothetical protein